MGERTGGSKRSQEACPVCGAHRLSVLDFPDVPTLGYQAYSELLGMGEPHATTPPGIGCLECGAEWRDLAAFRAGEPPVARPADAAEPDAGEARDR